MGQDLMGQDLMSQDLRTFTCPHCRRVQRHIIESTVTEAWPKTQVIGDVMYQREECLPELAVRLRRGCRPLAPLRMPMDTENVCLSG